MATRLPAWTHDAVVSLAGSLPFRDNEAFDVPPPLRGHSLVRGSSTKAFLSSIVWLGNWEFCEFRGFWSALETSRTSRTTAENDGFFRQRFSTVPVSDVVVDGDVFVECFASVNL